MLSTLNYPGSPSTHHQMTQSTPSTPRLQNKTNVGYASQTPKTMTDTLSFSGGNKKLDTTAALQEREAELREYYHNAQAITEFIAARIINAVPTMGNATSRDVNQYFDRIPFNGGMALSVSGSGLPNQLFTPLGQMQILGDGSVPTEMADIMEELTERLGLVRIHRRSNYDTIYAITKDLDGNPLPALSLADLSAGYPEGSQVSMFEELNTLLQKVVPEKRRRVD